MRATGISLLLLASTASTAALQYADREHRVQFRAVSNPMTTTIAGRAEDQDMGTPGDAGPTANFHHYGADFFDVSLGGPPPPYNSAMDGVGTEAKFRKPVDISGKCDDSSLHGTCDLYVVDANDHKVRKLHMDDRLEYVVETLAGDGRPAFKDHVVGGAASFNTPSGIVVDAAGTTAYVADRGNDRIRSVNLVSGSVDTVAGHNGAVGRFVRLFKVHDGTGLQIADIQAFGPGGEQYTAVGATMSTGDPSGCGDGDRHTLCQTDLGQQLDYQIQVDFGQQVDISKVMLYAQGGNPSSDALLVNAVISVCPNETWTSVWQETISTSASSHQFHPWVPGGTHDNAIGTEANFNKPTGVALSPTGNTLYVSEQGLIAHVIRKVDLTPNGTHAVEVLLGDAPGTWEGVGRDARFNYPAGLTIDPLEPDVLYVADSGNHQIRRVQISTATTSPYAGHHTHGWDYADGVGTEAKFGTPYGIAVHTIQKCDGTRDRHMFVAEQGNHRIRAINMDTKLVTTVAGQEYSGQVDAGAFTARFNSPSGLQIAFAGSGKRYLYVADTENYAIRRVLTNVAMSKCADLQMHASFTVSNVVPLGAEIYATLKIDTSYLGANGGTASNDWVGLYKAGDCADATEQTEVTLSGLHKCYIAMREITTAGLSEFTSVFTVNDYREAGKYEVRYFTQNSGANTLTRGYVCGEEVGYTGRMSDDDRKLCWLDVYVTSSVIDVGKNIYSVQATPDPSPFNGIKKEMLQQMVPGIEYDSLA